MQPNITKLSLDNKEVDAIESLLFHVERTYVNEEHPAFLADAKMLTAKLPERLRQYLSGFATHSGSEICLVSGLPIDPLKLAPTPADICLPRSSKGGNKENYLFLLFSALLGDAFGWSTQQNGRLIHDILPVKGHEHEQISSGSKETITLHCEDAFHEHRADFIGLMCLRNPDRISTTFAKPNIDELSAEHKELLFQPEFIIRADDSHLPENNPNDNGEMDVFNPEQKMSCNELDEGIKIAPLFGPPDSPFIRLDRYFMEQPEKKYAQALEALCNNLEKNIFDLALEPGDVAFADNYRILHGRRKFVPSYDGQDRWLKRINITANLAASIEYRLSADARVIY